MSLTRACEAAAELSDLDLVRLREFVRLACEARGYHEPIRPLPRGVAADLDELEPRVAISPRADTLPAPPPEEDDGG